MSARIGEVLERERRASGSCNLISGRFYREPDGGPLPKLEIFPRSGPAAFSNSGVRSREEFRPAAATAVIRQTRGTSSFLAAAFNQFCRVTAEIRRPILVSW